MELDLWQAGPLFAVGVIGGGINVVAGGGSLLTVPVMVFLGLPGPVANGTNRGQCWHRTSPLLRLSRAGASAIFG
ncbi:MAG: hypothetical protein R3E50_05730 [Halioglobus sp.]